MLSISIVIPIFNEKDNIENLLEEIVFCTKNFNTEIVLIDDGSTDNTLNIINILANKYDNILVKHFDTNKGQSLAIYEGVKISKNNIIVTLDADGQNDPRDIAELLSIYNKKKYKLVGGIRNKRKDKFIKIISSKIANYVRKKILKDNCDDTGCSLKVFDRDIFLNFTYFDVIHRFLPALFSGYGHKTFFINVNHRARYFGKSKYGTYKRLIKGIIGIVKVYSIIKNNGSKFYK